MKTFFCAAVAKAQAVFEGGILALPTSRGGFGGGDGCGGQTLSCRPEGPPFELFSDIQFWLTDSKFFLKASSAPIYTYFNGERATKKRNFLVKFSKMPKNAFGT